MGKVGRPAFAAALMAGISASVVGALLVAAPAEARKERAAAETFSLSDEVRVAATAARSAIAAHDFAAAQPAVVRVEAAAQNDDEKYVAAQLRLQLELAQSDATPGTARSEVALASALDFLINYSRTPKAVLPGYLVTRANIFYRSRQFDRAAVYYKRARDAGYKFTDLDLLARAEMESGDLTGGAQDFEMAINAAAADGKKPPEPWYRYLIARFYRANKPAETSAWTAKWLSQYPSKSNWHEAIIALGFQEPGNKRLNDEQRLDLFRLMHATESMGGQDDYTEYATSAAKLGLPAEAKSVIEEGRTNGAIPPKDTPTVAVMTAATAAIKAKPLAAQEKAAGDNPAKLAAAGDAALSQRSLTKAVALYDQALAKGATAIDDITLHRAIALALAGQKAEAVSSLAAVSSAPNKEIAQLWKTWLDAA